MRTMRINVKMATEVDSGDAAARLFSIPGVTHVVHTFPDEEDPDLARLYLLEVEDSSVQGVLAQLSASPSVDYAEEAAPRKPTVRT